MNHRILLVVPIDVYGLETEVYSKVLTQDWMPQPRTQIGKGTNYGLFDEHGACAFEVGEVLHVLTPSCPYRQIVSCRQWVEAPKDKEAAGKFDGKAIRQHWRGRMFGSGFDFTVQWGNGFQPMPAEDMPSDFWEDAGDGFSVNRATGCRMAQQRTHGPDFFLGSPGNQEKGFTLDEHQLESEEFDRPRLIYHRIRTAYLENGLMPGLSALENHTLAVEEYQRKLKEAQQ